MKNLFYKIKMIRENYGNISGSSNSESGGSSSSGLNEQQVISLINSQTVQNLTNNFNSSDFNSFTNLNNWVNNKVNTIIENPVEEVYNRIKSDLYDPQISHTPINNICFSVAITNTLGTRNSKFFNTNNLVFETMITKPYNEGLQINKGDVVVVFYKTQYSNNYVINNMMIILGGHNMSSSGVALSVPFNSSGNVTYFRANPFTAYYNSTLSNTTSVPYNTSIELRTNARCMNNTDIVNLNYDPSKINYYFLWSGSNDPSDNTYIDFTNIFKTDVNMYNLMLNKACDSSVLDLPVTEENLSRLGFNSIGQTNGIQNEIINMFSDKNILNDLRKVYNLFQTYSLQTIYSGNISNSFYFTKLQIDQSIAPVKSDNPAPKSATVYIMFLADLSGNIVGIDLVYCPTGCEIRNPSTKVGNITAPIYYQCNNIFDQDNDLFLSFTGCMNLNRNLTFTINFMDIRNSEYSTHLIIYSKKLSLVNLFNQFNATRMYMAKYMLFNFNYLNTNCYHVNLDDYLEQKQGTIMDTYESDNIRISFDKLM